MGGDQQIRSELTELLDRQGRFWLISPRMTQAEKVGFLYCLSILDHPTNPVRSLARGKSQGSGRDRGSVHGRGEDTS